ncbi:MAG: 2-C-methyl-D-erythritol 4-phosphate cytidylyltransferase [bacterium]|nr:2-C-methyl-D-erythritol 4-phosphate cytidylyltransferase [bacterium]
MKTKKIYTAIVLAAGSGNRMKSEVPKQYLPLAGKPLIYYALKAFEESEVDDIVLVTAPSHEEYCKKEIIERYGLNKVKAIVAGGDERYLSVWSGIKAATNADYVLIHDGARPFIDNDLIARIMDMVALEGACTVGVPAKDTIRVVDSNNYGIHTPDRSTLWQVQTPQAFSYSVIAAAYEQVIAAGGCIPTDDAQVLELATGQKSKMIEGSYRNIKVTTPEDLLVANCYVNE